MPGMPLLSRLVSLAMLGLSTIPHVLSFQPGFDYGSTKVRGVNLGGWLVLEVRDSNVTPNALFSSVSSLGSRQVYSRTLATVTSSMSGPLASIRTMTLRNRFCRTIGIPGSPKMTLKPLQQQGTFKTKIYTLRNLWEILQLEPCSSPHWLLGIWSWFRRTIHNWSARLFEEGHHLGIEPRPEAHYWPAWCTWQSKRVNSPHPQHMYAVSLIFFSQLR